jgi:hypothetical protein
LDFPLLIDALMLINSFSFSLGWGGFTGRCHRAINQGNPYEFTIRQLAE